MAVEKEQAKPSEESKPSAEADMGRKAPGTASAPSWFTPKRYFLVLGGFLFFLWNFWLLRKKERNFLSVSIFVFWISFWGFAMSVVGIQASILFYFFVYWFLRKCRIWTIRGLLGCWNNRENVNRENSFGLVSLSFLFLEANVNVPKR
jgi:hypothetical protein